MARRKPCAICACRIASCSKAPGVLSSKRTTTKFFPILTRLAAPLKANAGLSRRGHRVIACGRMLRCRVCIPIQSSRTARPAKPNAFAVGFLSTKGRTLRPNFSALRRPVGADRSSRHKEAHFSNAECGVRNAELSQSLLTSAATRFMGRENLQNSDANRGHEPVATVLHKTLLQVKQSFVARRNGSDRKSTRLNSSHSQISYAVFCLKKKKKT